MAETGLTKNQILSELSRSPHGKLDEYVPVCRKAVAQEPEFTAHLISWNRIKGQVRDSKVALPVISLSVLGQDPEFKDNALAHVAMLGLRELERAYRFAWDLRDKDKSPWRQTLLPIRRVVTQRLRTIEADWKKWERTAIQHRSTLANLYAVSRTSQDEKVRDILFRGANPEGTLFETVAKLKDMDPVEAAGTIIEKRLPFLIAAGALGDKMKNPDLVMALISRMSSTELVTNMRLLDSLGVKTNPVLRAALEKGLEKASKSKKNVLKTTRAADALGDDALSAKLRGVQEKQLDNMSVEGNWLVLGDKSGSMHSAMEVAKKVAGILAKMAKGQVHLVFFDTVPSGRDVSGMTYEEIVKLTRHERSGGSTSIGCGLKWALEKKLDIDGIAIVSDGGENSAPYFPVVHAEYTKWSGKDVPVYLYHCDGDHNALANTMNTAKIDMQVFELGRSVDFYSLPNIVSTMRTNRYSLVDEVMQAPLLKLADVLKVKEQPEVEAAEAVA